MPIPVFDQQKTLVPEEDPKEGKKHKLAPTAIFLFIVLTIVLFVLGEFMFRDVNKVFNPNFDSCHSSIKGTIFQPVKIPVDCDLNQYERIRLILHADIAVPLVLIGILLFIIVRGRKMVMQVKALVYAYLLFSLWMAARIVAETEYYFLKHHELYGKYILFITLIVILSALIILVQKKFKKKSQP